MCVCVLQLECLVRAQSFGFFKRHYIDTTWSPTCLHCFHQPPLTICKAQTDRSTESLFAANWPFKEMDNTMAPIDMKGLPSATSSINTAIREGRLIYLPAKPNPNNTDNLYICRYQTPKSHLTGIEGRGFFVRFHTQCTHVSQKLTKLFYK